MSPVRSNLPVWPSLLQYHLKNQNNCIYSLLKLVYNKIKSRLQRGYLVKIPLTYQKHELHYWWRCLGCLSLWALHNTIPGQCRCLSYMDIWICQRWIDCILWVHLLCVSCSVCGSLLLNSITSLIWEVGMVMFPLILKRILRNTWWLVKKYCFKVLNENAWGCLP